MIWAAQLRPEKVGNGPTLRTSALPQVGSYIEHFPRGAPFT
jgi:hypothetical protein